VKYLYVYRENTSRQISAKTRSWEKAEERAQEIRDSWSPVKALQRELEAKVRKSEAREVLITDAVVLFLKEVERLNREEATRAKYRLTLEDRLLNWCAQPKPRLLVFPSWTSKLCAGGSTRGPVHPRLGTISTSGSSLSSSLHGTRMDKEIQPGKSRKLLRSRMRRSLSTANNMMR